MAIKITTSDYLKDKHVLVDGNDWTIKLPGAGTELRMSQSQRRMKLLDRKIENGSATDDDLDLYDKLENESMDMFYQMFNDGSETNKSVKEWIISTPLSVIMAAFKEIKRQSEDKEVAEDGTTE
jgi:hypothetical protein